MSSLFLSVISRCDNEQRSGGFIIPQDHKFEMKMFGCDMSSLFLSVVCNLIVKQKLRYRCIQYCNTFLIHCKPVHHVERKGSEVEFRTLTKGTRV